MRALKILYRKNLNMSPGKLAAQSVHAATMINHWDPRISIRVLAASDQKYYEEIGKHPAYDVCRVFDAGLTEIDPGTETCCAFYEEE